MSQSLIITLITAALLFSSSFGNGGGQVPSERPPGIESPGESLWTGTVTAQQIALHSAPGKNDGIATLNKGDFVTVIEEQKQYVKVRTATGQLGYVATFAIQRVGGNGANTAVLGYYLQGASKASLEQNFWAMSSISPWMWQVGPSGQLVANFDMTDIATALKFAGEKQLETYALIHNNDGHLFNDELIHGILVSPANRKNLIDSIFTVLRDWEMTGVQIDFEFVPVEDRDYLTTFIQELATKLRPHGYRVTMAVPAKTTDTPRTRWSGAFDYARLGTHLDQMMVMTYDESYVDGPPGPIASIGWVERVVKFALESGVPAHKLVLGVAGYGYDWSQAAISGNNVSARAVTYQQAMRLKDQYGVPLQWDDHAKVPYITYGQGNRVYFEDRFSLSHKLALVNQYKLAGISLWRLGQEDPGSWQVIHQMLHK